MPLKFKKCPKKDQIKMQIKNHMFELVDDRIIFCTWKALNRESKKKKNANSYTILALIIIIILQV